ncbi:FAD-containing monooxygenase EthA, partial [Pseudomonas aeruginosa]
ALDSMPRQGPREPWEMSMDYFRDIKLMRRGKVADECLRFSTVPDAYLHRSEALQTQGGGR